LSPQDGWRARKTNPIVRRARFKSITVFGTTTEAL
jgi:hypothetical protein